MVSFKTALIDYARTNPVARTAPVSDSPPVNPWVTFDNMSLNDQNQSLNVPVFTKNDFVWTPNPSYDPNSPGGQMEYRQFSDTYGGWEWVPDGTLSQGKWSLSPEAEQRLKAGGWDIANPNNIAWNNNGDLTSGVSGAGGWFVNEDPNAKLEDLISNVTMKNSRSTGLNFKYIMDPQSGSMVPVYTGGSDYITNTGEANRKALAAFGALIGAGFAIPEIAAAAGASGTAAAPAGGSWGVVDPAFTAWNAVPAAEAATTAGIGALDPYALTAAELGAPVETYLGAAPVAGEASGAAAGISEGLGSLYGTVGSTPYVPEVGPYAPGEAPGTISAPSPSIGDYASRVGDWLLRNPRLVLSGIGAVGSLLEDNNNSGSGGTGGGTGAGGWTGPIPSMSAVQARFDPPAGYRPGFSPEHVYIETAYGPGAASVPIQMSTTSSGATPLPPPNIPPLPPQTFAAGGAVSPWAMPTGIQALRIPTRRSLGTGPQYQSPEPVGGLPALFNYLNTQPTAPPLLTTRDLSPATQYASWAQTGFNPTLTNNWRASTRAGPVVYAGGTRGGFGGYGIGQFAEGGLVQGPGTGTSDSIPAVIDGDVNQPAALSKNEFVLPAWLVEEIGDGSSQTGAQRLYAFMERMKAQRGNQLSINSDALSELA